MTTTPPHPIVPPPPKVKEKRKPRLPKRNQIPGHEIFLMICEQIGNDITAEKTVVIDAEDTKSALRLRVNFYNWRSATIKELGESFALDSKLADVRIKIEPALGPNGEILRNAKGQPIDTNRVIFHSIRNTRETQALVRALPQLGINLPVEEKV